MHVLRQYRSLKLSTLLAATLALGACDLLSSPLGSTRDKVLGANQELLTLVETARLGAYRSKGSFADTATTYGGIIAKLKSASLDLTPVDTETNPRASLVAVIDACAARVTALSQQHRRFGLNPKGAYQVTTNDCRLAEIAVKEDI